MSNDHDVVSLTRELLAIDTIDPPGNEEQAARVVGRVLASEGIASELQEIAPGRTNLIARLKGTGSRVALSMSAHIDTIGVDRSAWTRDPFAGEIVDGRLYGRGATDMKGVAAMTLAMIATKRAGKTLRGDFLLTLMAAENSACWEPRRW